MTRAASAALVLLLLAGGMAPAAPQDTPASREIPTATGEQLLQRIAAEKGKVVVVNFWATWCAPCVRELPELIAFYRAADRDRVQLLGFAADNPQTIDSELAPFVARKKIPYPIVVIDPGDDPSRLIERFGDAFTGVLPTTVVYDRAGHVSASHRGMITREQLRALVDQALVDE